LTQSKRVALSGEEEKERGRRKRVAISGEEEKEQPYQRKKKKAE
jgi:hypothetical protein